MVEDIQRDITNMFYSIRQSHYDAHHSKISYDYDNIRKINMLMYTLAGSYTVYFLLGFGVLYMYVNIIHGTPGLLAIIVVLLAVTQPAEYVKKNFIIPAAKHRDVQKYSYPVESIEEHLNNKSVDWVESFMIPTYIRQEIYALSRLMSYGTLYADKDDTILEKIEKVSIMLGFQREMSYL